MSTTAIQSRQGDPSISWCMMPSSFWYVRWEGIEEEGTEFGISGPGPTVPQKSGTNLRTRARTEEMAGSTIVVAQRYWLDQARGRSRTQAP